METLTQYWNEAWAFFREGLYHMKPIQGLVIGILFALMVNSVPGLFIVPALASVVYIAADVLIPSLVHHKDLVLPHFDRAFWYLFLSLYCVFFVAGAIALAIKSLFGRLTS